MYKSGLIIGGVALVLAIGSTLISPLCVPCLALFLGLGAGYLAGVFEKPSEQPAATKSGAIAGAVGGAGIFLGQMIGTVINGFIVGPEGVAQILEGLDLPADMAGSAGSYWASLIGGNCCMGLFSVGLMAGLGALGGLLWWQTKGKNLSTPPANVMPQ